MSSAAGPVVINRSLLVILSAAAIQGVSLYALHLSVRNQHWPATDSGWLLALYALAAFAPLTVQFLADHIHDRRLWPLGLALVVAWLYFGWHHGTYVLAQLQVNDWDDRVFPLAVLLGLLWLLTMPFVQCHLLEGSGWPNYHTLFTVAWRNKLTLAETVAFTGLFWLLLGLWAQLFKMLGIELFAKVFAEPIFIYPVTALVFGLALLLVGSLTRLVSVVLEQVLNVLKWLAVIAGLILALFSLALATKVPDLIATGARTIGAAWLLWLVAVMVLLINAAYRDGKVAAPYPRWLGMALRCVLPLLIIVVFTAAYAIYLRVDARGITVGRFWACVVVVIATLYAAGYGYVALRHRQWMGGIDRINIVAAWFLIAVIVLALTPLLSPYRIAAASQFNRAKLSWQESGDAKTKLQTPLEYLRFDAGSYGAERLAQLAKLQDHPDAAAIRDAAKKLLARANRWDAGLSPLSIEARLSHLTLYPPTRSLEPDLRALLVRNLQAPPGSRFNANGAALSGLFVDLDEDGIEEFVLLAGGEGLLYARHKDQTLGQTWFAAGQAQAHRCCSDEAVAQAIQAGEVEVLPPRWRDLIVGKSRFHISGHED